MQNKKITTKHMVICKKQPPQISAFGELSSLFFSIRARKKPFLAPNTIFLIDTSYYKHPRPRLPSPGAHTPSKPRRIPLEIAVTEDKLPMYSVTTEDDGRGYAATKLPFQVHTGVADGGRRGGVTTVCLLCFGAFFFVCFFVLEGSFCLRPKASLVVCCACRCWL